MFRHLYKLRTGFRGQSRGEGGQEQEWRGLTWCHRSSALLRSPAATAAAPSSPSWNLTSEPHVHSVLNSMCRGASVLWFPLLLTSPEASRTLRWAQFSTRTCFAPWLDYEGRVATVLILGTSCPAMQSWAHSPHPVHISY